MVMPSISAEEFWERDGNAMESTIDRRQSGDSLFWYVIQDREFFEDFGATGSREFRQIIENLAPPDWALYQTGIWLHVLPQPITLPRQGFKIHISATAASATEVLRK